MKISELINQESGNALVELAFSLPLFVLLILGSAEIGNLAWSSIQLNNAAHAGAQFGSISRANAADTTDMGNAAQSEAPNLITSPTTQVTSTQVCTCVDPSTGNQNPSPAVTCTSTFISDNSCTSPKVVLASVQVTIQATVHPIFHYPGMPASYTLHGNATMGIIQ